MPPFCRKWLSCALLVACCLAAASASAETIRVRGGEHDGFTRLALDLPRALTWRVVERDNRFDLVFEAPNLTFDLSAAQTRLNAGRIKSVEQGQKVGVLQVGLNCDCAANAFLFDGTMLVVDVTERRSADADATGERKSSSFLTTFWIDTAVLGAQHDTTPVMKQHHASPDAADEETEKMIDAPVGPDLATALANPTTTPRAVAARPDASAAAPRRPDELHALVTTALQQAKDQRLQGINLAIRNGAEQPEPRDRLAAMAAEREKACLADKDLNIATWAREGRFASLVGGLRSELYGEFDRSRRDIALDLAKVHIFFGFGLEARQILDEFVEDAAHLDNIASLIETGTIAGENVFADALSCDSDAALWSMLGHEAGAIAPGFDPSAVLTAFDRLPPTLRTHLASALSERFRSVGMLENASEVLRVAARSGVAAGPGAKLAGALIGKDENRTVAASEALSELTEQNHEISPRAMIELVSLKMSNDGSLDYDTAQMARILQKEYARSDHAAELRFSTVVALALSDAFAESLDALAGLRANVGIDAFRQAQDFLYDRIARKASDPMFLSAALTLTPGILNELDPETVFRTADRLVALGFPDATIDLLGPAFRGHDMQEGRLLRAAAHLSLANPDRAAAELAGLDGARAIRLRARLSEATRDFEQALALYRQLGDDDKVDALRQVVAGLSENADTGVISDGDAAGPPRETAPIEFSRRRVDASADTRRGVEALLAEAPVE